MGLQSLFCAHDYELIFTYNVTKWGKSIGYQNVYVCRKCKKKKVINY